MRSGATTTTQMDQIAETPHHSRFVLGLSIEQRATAEESGFHMKILSKMTPLTILSLGMHKYWMVKP